MTDNSQESAGIGPDNEATQQPAPAAQEPTGAGTENRSDDSGAPTAHSAEPKAQGPGQRASESPQQGAQRSPQSGAQRPQHDGAQPSKQPNVREQDAPAPGKTEAPTQQTASGATAKAPKKPGASSHAVPVLKPKTKKSRMLAIGRACLLWCRDHPVTLSFVVILVVLAFATGPLVGPNEDIRFAVGTGLSKYTEEGVWWSILTYPFFTDSLFVLIGSVVLAAVFMGVGEKVMGSWRTILAFFTTLVVGTGMGILVQWVLSMIGELWANDVQYLSSIDPTVPITGVLFTASAAFPAVWRRRLLTIALPALIMLMLYSGPPADFYRLCAALTGLLLGRLLYGGHKGAVTWTRSSKFELRRLMASLVALTAIGPFISVLSAARIGLLAPLAEVFTPENSNTTSLPKCEPFQADACVLPGHGTNYQILDQLGSALPLVLLIFAAYGIYRGRRFAVWLAAVLNALFAIVVAYVFAMEIAAAPVDDSPVKVEGPDIEALLQLFLIVGVHFAMAVALILLRKRFEVLASARKVRRFYIGVVLSFLVLAAIYVFVGYALRDEFSPHIGIADLIGDVPARFLPMSFRHVHHAFHPHSMATAILFHSVGPLFVLCTLAASISPMLDTQLKDDPGHPARVKELLRIGGGSSLSFMASWQGNSYWFDPMSNAAIAFQVKSGVAITVTGPFGDLNAPPRDVMRRFATYCDEQGWIPVFYSVPGTYRDDLASLGFTIMEVGEESVLRPQEWKTTGKKWQDVRSAINRAAKDGVRSVWTSYADLTIRTARQITQISEEWVSDKALPEMEFTLGGLDELRDPDVKLMLAVDAEDRIQGVTSWLPTWREGTIIGWTLDFMRRRPDSMPGIMEFLIAESAVHMKEEGIEFLSLSAAPLAGSMGGASGDRSSLDELLEFLSSSLEPVYGFRSLLNFKKKFQPEFVPVLMAFPDSLQLPQIGLALTRAYLPSLSMTQAAKFALQLR